MHPLLQKCKRAIVLVLNKQWNIQWPLHTSLLCLPNGSDVQECEAIGINGCHCFLWLYGPDGLGLYELPGIIAAGHCIDMKCWSSFGGGKGWLRLFLMLWIERGYVVQLDCHLSLFLSLLSWTENLCYWYLCSELIQWPLYFELFLTSKQQASSQGFDSWIETWVSFFNFYLFLIK